MPRPHRRLIVPVQAFAAICLVLAGSQQAMAEAVSSAGKKLAAVLDRLDVEHHWIAGIHVDWQTGEPDGRPETSQGKHTHCSAFVAAAAQQLGVYILRPPEHGQILLANAQYEWLADDGATNGWRRIKDDEEAQHAANDGALVVAAYHNHYDDKPGHIAIVYPSDRSPEAIAAEGPEIVQAGGHNYASTTLKQGFAGHRSAWSHSEVVYYAHAVQLPP